MTQQSSLAAVAAAAAGAPIAVDAGPVVQPAAPGAAPAPTQAAAPAVANIGAAEALELVATGYPNMSAVLTPLAAKVRAGCDEAGFGRAVLEQVASGKTSVADAPAPVAVVDTSKDNVVKTPTGAGGAAVAVPAATDIYAQRAESMRG